MHVQHNSVVQVVTCGRMADVMRRKKLVEKR